MKLENVKRRWTLSCQKLSYVIFAILMSVVGSEVKIHYATLPKLFGFAVNATTIIWYYGGFIVSLDKICCNCEEIFLFLLTLYKREICGTSELLKLDW